MVDRLLAALSMSRPIIRVHPGRSPIVDRGIKNWWSSITAGRTRKTLTVVSEGLELNMLGTKIRTRHDAIQRKRILIVNCYFDCSHRPIHRAFKIPQAVGPIYLAGAFSRELCEVRCYTELASGPLEDEKLLAWPDMLVLTGLTNSFDRML